IYTGASFLSSCKETLFEDSLMPISIVLLLGVCRAFEGNLVGSVHRVLCQGTHPHDSPIMSNDFFVDFVITQHEGTKSLHGNANLYDSRVATVLSELHVSVQDRKSTRLNS